MFNNSSISVLPNVFKEELKLYVYNVNHVLWYIQIMICVYGLLGNLLALIVINQKSLRNTSSAVFITYMAIFDSAVLVFHAVNLSKPPQNLYLLCFLSFLTDLSIFCAHWVLVIITLERCVAVYSPFLAKRFCTIYSARRSMYLLLTIAIVFFSIAFPFLYEIKGLSSHEKCRIRKQARRFHRIFQPILFIAIPDILLLSNLFTVYALCRRRQRLSLSYVSNGEKIQMRISDVNSNRKQQQLTIMLVTVSLSFYLFTTPAMIVFIKELRPPKHKVLEKVKRDFLIAQMSVVLSELNNATNFIFYCFTGQRFRRASREVMRDIWRIFKLIYHRYILGNTEYRLLPAYERNFSTVGNTITTNRSSCSPHHPHTQNRQSTI